MIARTALRGRALLGAVLFAGGLFSMATMGAHASYGLCLDDPILVLSNHMTLHVNSAVQDRADDVHQIVYNITLPAGVSVQSMQSSGPLAGVTQVNISAGSSNAYTVSVSVGGGASVPFTVAMDVTTTGRTPDGKHAREDKGQNSASASGMSNSAPVLVTIGDAGMEHDATHDHQGHR